MLNIDTEQKLKLEPTDLIGKMVAVLGITGTGKTNTAAVLIEELFAAALPMSIIDIEGEYYGLKTRFEILVAGRSENVDLEVNPDQATQLAALSVERGVSVVVDVSEFDEAERFTFLVNYFKGLWQANFKLNRPYGVFVEEAHEFIPQGSAPSPELKTLITRLALRGRKRGFSVVVMSQRSAKVAKDVLTQASLVFLHQVVHPADLGVYKDLIPLPAKEVEEKVGGLAPGQCLVLNKNKIVQASIRLRHSLHVGATPQLGTVMSPELKSLDRSILDVFKRAVTAPPITEPVAQPGRSKTAAPADTKALELVKELKAQVAARDAEIERLRKRVAELEAVPAVQVKAVPATKPVVKVVPAAPDPLKAMVDKRREAAVARFLKQLKGLNKQQLELLLFLHNHEGKHCDMPTAAKKLGYGSDTLRPAPLVRLGILTRWKVDGTFHYTSTFSKYIKENLQGTDPDALIATIHQWL